MAETSGLTRALAWFAALVGVIVLYFAFTADSPETGASTRQDYLSAEACVRAQEAVRAKLKAPATASFPSCGEVKSDDNGTRFFVTGSVDSENSFGAKVRAQYAVMLSTAASGDLQVDKVAVE